jgi:hypothetical protein
MRASARAVFSGEVASVIIITYKQSGYTAWRFLYGIPKLKFGTSVSQGEK